MKTLDAVAEADEGDILTLGKVSGVFGVKGWVKIFSHTSPRQQIVKYSPLYLRKKGATGKDSWQTITVLKGQKQGKSVVAQLEGIDDRDQAFSMIGTEIGIKRDQLPKLSNDNFYWTDLEGVSVFTLDEVKLGNVGWVFNTGSNDVLVVKGKGDKEYMIPWIKEDVIKSIDLDESRIVVDWDPEF
ncbi:MAG: ribosome maturation factor RimM [Thiotrichaceae bacterium]